MNNLVIHTNPFRIHLDEEKREVEPMTVWELVAECGLTTEAPTAFDFPKRKIPFVVTIDGVYVLEKDWPTVTPDGSLIQIVYLPKGGGSNIGTILGAILVAVMAYFTFGLSLVAAAAVGAAAYVGLTVIGNMVPKPTGPDNDRDRASPTYSLGAQGNNARLMEAIPRVYGTMRTFPDLASQPYTEYQGNEQYLYQLFALTLGEATVKNIYVDGTNIADFAEAKTEIIRPGGKVTLFPDNVITSSGVQNLTMYGPNSPSFTTLGPFNVSAAGSTTNFIGLDICFPQGLRTIDEKNGNTKTHSVTFEFEYQEIDVLGSPIGAWKTLLRDTVSMATPTPQYKSYKVSVPEARYRVQGRRVSPEAANDTTVEMTQWLAMRGYVTSNVTYPNVTMIAVMMKATNVLNSTTARKFSVVSTGLVQKWDAVNGWSGLIESDNPAWIAADAIRNPVYGRGLTTDRFNIQALATLAQVWATRDDGFNGVFDTTIQFWDALTRILRVGRATPIYYAGVIDFVRDEAKTIPESMFQPSNMIADSFRAVYNFDDMDTPDHIVMEYIDGETWEPATIKCVLPGSTELKPYNVTLQGCTDRKQAWREGISMAAANRDRRRNISFQTHSAGLVPYYNSLTRISHDVPQWGYFGRVLSLDKTTGVLRTTEPIPFTDGQSHVIAFRKKNGSSLGPFRMVAATSLSSDKNEWGARIDESAAVLATISISDGIREDYTTYQCGPTDRQGILALITSATPTSDGMVNITCINYADSVHSAEYGGNVPPPGPESNLPTIPTAPIVATVQVFDTFEMGVQNIVASPAIGAIYYDFEIRLDGSDGWAALGTNGEPSLTSNMSPGMWSVRVRGVGRTPGPWATWHGEIRATTLPTCRLATFVPSSELFAIGLRWTYADGAQTMAENIEIYASASNSLTNALRLVQLPYPADNYVHTNRSASEVVYYWARVIDKAGRPGPYFNNGLAIAGTASADAAKILDTLTGKIKETQLFHELVEKINSGGGASAEVEALVSELAAMYTIKTQLTVDGRHYLAGIGVGVENTSGTTIESQILLAASRVAIIDPNTPNSSRFPFIVQGGQVFMNSAIIQDGSIVNAKIGNTIEASALGANNQPRWKLDKAGTMTMTGANNGDGYLTITDRLITVFDGNGVMRVRMGIF